MRSRCGGELYNTKKKKKCYFNEEGEEKETNPGVESPTTHHYTEPRDRDRQTDRQTDRQRHRDRARGRQTERQTDRQTQRETQRDTKSLRDRA